jgi:hypothetical protein
VREWTPLWSHEEERNEKCTAEKCSTESSVFFSLLGVLTLDSPVESRGAANETHDGVDKSEGGTFIIDKLRHQEGKWNSEANGEGRRQILIEVILDRLSLHGVTLGVDAHTNG